MLTKAELEQQMQRRPFAALGDLIYERLYEDIIMLRLMPSTRLNESKIAAELGLSRSPVKDAVSRLIAQGLVKKEDGKLPFVSPVDKEECRRLYEARVGIEGYAAFLASKRITSEELHSLAKLVAEYAEIGEQIDIQRYAECDHKFHAIVIQAAHNPHIIEMYDCIERRILRYRRCLHHKLAIDSLQSILSSASRYHKAVYQALRMGLSEVARSEIIQDIGGMLDVFSEWG